MHHSRAVVAVLLAVLFVQSARAEDPPPAVAAAPVVEHFHSVLIEVMKDANALGLEGRKEKLAPALDATYDFPTMAQRSIATGWAKLDASQRERFIAAFRGLTLRTYATRFDGYSKESFETTGEEPSVAKTVIVRTVLHTETENIHLDYRLRSTPAGWRVIDVYLSGTVSELALRRAEYTSVLEREGFDALLSALERKVSDSPGVPPRSSDSRLK
jgi:phospholipid transport system substrate-binding protein